MGGSVLVRGNDLLQSVHVLEHVESTVIVGTLREQLEPLTAGLDRESRGLVLQLDGRCERGRADPQIDVRTLTQLARSELQSNLCLRVLLVNLPRESVLKVSLGVEDRARPRKTTEGKTQVKHGQNDIPSPLRVGLITDLTLGPSRSLPAHRRHC